jgi:hypothetical protein
MTFTAAGQEPRLITATVTSTSQTLRELLGEPLGTSARFTLVPHASGITMGANAAADADSMPLGTERWRFCGHPRRYENVLEFWAESGTKLSVLIEDP